MAATGSRSTTSSRALHSSCEQGDENRGERDAALFAEAINGSFIEERIGWQLVNGQIVTRGTEDFKSIVRDITTALERRRGPRRPRICMRAAGPLAPAAA